jgi:hypothetical protein
MRSLHLATDEPILQEALLLLAIVGGLLELGSSLLVVLELFGCG